MIKLKICGMRETENILQVASLSPDYMGFIFYSKSPRFVGENFVIPDQFPAIIKRVGVFVNERVEDMLAKRDKHRLDMLQLHGDESPDVCEVVRRSGTKVIKVFSVDDKFDFESTIPYKNVVDYFLFDTKGKYYGGNATPFDWRVLERYDQNIPFFLSGGLNPENISGIHDLKGMNVHAVDVNSGVERSPGIKDPALVGRIANVLDK